MEILLEIREQMSRDADYDVDLFSERVRAGNLSDDCKKYEMGNSGKNKQSEKKDS